MLTQFRLPQTVMEFERTRQRIEGSASKPDIIEVATSPVNPIEIIPIKVAEIKTEVKKSKMKKWPSNPLAIVPYGNLIAPIKAILDNGYRLIRKVNATSFDYTGYNIGPNELLFYPNPKQRLTEQALTKSGKKGETLFDTMLNIVFLLGIEQGRRANRIKSKQTKDIVSVLAESRNTNNKLRRKIDALKEEVAILKSNPFISQDELLAKVKEGVKRNRLARIEFLKKEMAKDPSNVFSLPAPEKAKFSDLVLLANSFEKGKCSKEQWSSILTDHGWDYNAWRKKCKKKKTTTSID
jgi:hypothetical protein